LVDPVVDPALRVAKGHKCRGKGERVKGRRANG
jgi:hypothetical protein